VRKYPEGYKSAGAFVPLRNSVCVPTVATGRRMDWSPRPRSRPKVPFGGTAPAIYPVGYSTPGMSGHARRLRRSACTTADLFGQLIAPPLAQWGTS